MREVRTLDQLQSALDQELGWRLKEIAAFNVASKANNQQAKHFVRAGVALIYAHWEGFIKASSEIYLSYVGHRRLTYRDLKSCFAVFGLKSKLGLLSASRKSTPNIAAFDFILDKLDEVATMNLASAINTESNLTSKVFENIASSLDINSDAYDTKFNLIDESLVKRRNSIAHGEYLEISGKEYGELAAEIVGLMRSYKTDLENAASLQSYKRPVAV
jgi:hypothetical protein